MKVNEKEQEETPQSEEGQIDEEDTVAAGEAERNIDKIITPEEAKREIAQPKVAPRTKLPNNEKKCFVKIVAIGDSGVGKTSLI